MDFTDEIKVPSLFSESANSITGLLLAAVVPLLCLRVFSFLYHTWPNFLYRHLTSRLDRQIATVEERVRPNRIIQDDLMIRNIMGYVSYCYVRTLQRAPNACDAVAEADYEYTCIFNNSDTFEEEWVPYSARFDSLFGRVIASCMELSVIPSCGQSIQVEPGLFVRSLLNKHVTGGGGDDDDEHKSGSDYSQLSSKDSGGSKQLRAPVGTLNQVDKLNNYLFYSMRKYTEDMDEHPEPCSEGRIDEVCSEKGPFDPAAGKTGARGKKRRSGDGGHSESAFFGDSESAPEERMIIIEYRKPLPHEHSQALCESRNIPGGIREYEASRSAEDVIEGFLGRVHAWYLGHIAQSRTRALMVIYPSMRMTASAKNGTGLLQLGCSSASDAKISGRCYVLDSAAPVSVGTAAGDCATATAAVPKLVSPTTTIAGGQIGLRCAALSSKTRGKTFNSLFFPEKERILSILDEFVEERGRFGVPGVAPRLNFFLHGAPGTGKTSFVKALARYLWRNLVVVSMSDILTVGELQDILQPFDMELSRSRQPGEDAKTISVRPHQCVYVFEDFDAIGDAWVALKKVQEQRIKLAEERQLGEANMSSGNKVRGGNQSDCGKPPAVSPPSSARSRTGNSLDGDDDDSHDNENSLNETEVYEQLARDHITVKRFIDLFNGLNLPDAFIAVFTTNHPERIHPLIRSSTTMDVTLDLGMLDDECATQMVEHYYAAELATQAGDGGSRGRLSVSQLTELRAALQVFNTGSSGLSGAQLEKMCIACDTVSALTARLRSVDSLDVVDVF
ncbi:hypothetical protein JKF63_01631 [Porcisia hertigi]|uniref:AAA+ ATPase domain-containing protein n=1 Tax=Porcisia hertigi TaxID=2761500 RepID=A0A836HJD0_9TRYP|nr:hypothetical protein JKF63_01631 [Porcisia hertigi]